jgi:hypothetical protein
MKMVGTAQERLCPPYDFAGTTGLLHHMLLAAAGLAA